MRKEIPPPLFKLENLEDNPIENVFNVMDLQSFDKPETYKVEKIVNNRTRNCQKELFVMWLVYPPSMSSVIFAKDAVTLFHNAF